RRSLNAIYSDGVSVSTSFFPDWRYRYHARRISSPMTNRQGVMNSTWSVELTIPPMLGAAMGFIISIPGPLEKVIGRSESMIDATVINLGRSREVEPSITASMYD